MHDKELTQYYIYMWDMTYSTFWGSASHCVNLFLVVFKHSEYSWWHANRITVPLSNLSQSKERKQSRINHTIIIITRQQITYQILQQSSLSLWFTATGLHTLLHSISHQLFPIACYQHRTTHRYELASWWLSVNGYLGLNSVNTIDGFMSFVDL